ncbi:MAG: hypothetical protein ACRDOH_28710 [Streptosporangiaceae bacterium]
MTTVSLSRMLLPAFHGALAPAACGPARPVPVRLFAGGHARQLLVLTGAALAGIRRTHSSRTW